jgi:hypothetical protein
LSFAEEKEEERGKIEIMEGIQEQQQEERTQHADQHALNGRSVCEEANHDGEQSGAEHRVNDEQGEDEDFHDEDDDIEDYEEEAAAAAADDYDSWHEVAGTSWAEAAPRPADC